MRAGVLLVLIGLSAFGWELADDKPRAAHIAVACTLAVSLWLNRSPRDRVLSIVAGTGAAIAALAAGCGAWYERLSSRDVGVCDEGSGMPARAAVGVVVLLVAAYVLRECRHAAAGR